MNTRVAALLKLIGSMLIFGSIGLFVKYIPLPSSMIAFSRALIGVLLLAAILLLKRKKLSASAIKRNLVYLILSGTAIGFNWILLFESYRYTTVAVSTLCYYMAPIIVTALSPLVLKERITAKRLLCIVIAVIGMVLISGVFNAGMLQSGEIIGILFGFGAAVLYASAILLNKQLSGISAMDRTVCQLFVASVVLLPYILLTCDFSSFQIAPVPWILLLVVGIVHTGLAYYLYFGSMEHLSGQSIAIASYIDPVVAVIVSIVLLREPFDMYSVIGAVLIIGAAAASEMPAKKGIYHDN